MNDFSGGELALGLGAMFVPMFISLVVCIFLIIVEWKIFTKAGKPGWACIVPIYNTWVLFEIAEGNGAKCFLTLIPFIGWIFAIMATLKLARSFGKSTGFGWGMLILPYIFWPMLAFGNNTYLGPQQ